MEGHPLRRKLSMTLLGSSNPEPFPSFLKEEASFHALGSVWNVSVRRPKEVFQHRLESAFFEVRRFLEKFESRFSRFVDGSEVNAFRSAKSGRYRVSDDFLELLKRSERIRNLTEGAFDVGMSGGLLERAGYGRLEPIMRADEAAGMNPHYWSLEGGNLLAISGPISFDFGGIGKGYAIDRASRLLTNFGFPRHLIEGGGDVYATSTEADTAYRAAIEWPGRPGMAVGMAELYFRSLAVSDVFKRRWGSWHHLVDVRSGFPIRSVVGCAVLAPTAFDADSATSALCFGGADRYRDISREFGAQFILFFEDGRIEVSSDWEGELF